MNRIMNSIIRKSAIILSLFLICSCESDMLNDSIGPHESMGNENDNLQAGSGVMTAGEWSDLENWDFWLKLTQNQDIEPTIKIWGWDCKNRISVQLVNNDGEPVINRKISLGDEKWTAMTNSSGIAHLWVGVDDEEKLAESYSEIYIDDIKYTGEILPYGKEKKVNLIKVNYDSEILKLVQVGFMVDATGSMADEIDFLKKDLVDIINKSEENLKNYKVETSAIFYRDQDDDYVVRSKDFCDIQDCIGFIKQQDANGGGDYEEAVHSALIESMKMSWNKNAKARILFVILDAPAHHSENDAQIIDQIHKSIEDAAESGITLIPVAASGVNKRCEFMLRQMAILTGGTYTFITDDSGVGGEHLDPTVGQYEVKLLNELILELILERANGEE